MKKIYLVFLTLLCLSCSKDDESSKSAISINPPAWVQGNWAQSDFEEDGAIFKISSNDVIFVVNTTELSYKGQMESFAKSGADVGVDEVITEDTYTVTFDMSQGVTQSYSFTKVDESTILWINSNMDIDLTRL